MFWGWGKSTWPQVGDFEVAIGDSESAHLLRVGEGGVLARFWAAGSNPPRLRQHRQQHRGRFREPKQSKFHPVSCNGPRLRRRGPSPAVSRVGSPVRLDHRFRLSLLHLRIHIPPTHRLNQLSQIQSTTMNRIFEIRDSRFEIEDSISNRFSISNQ